MVQNANTLLLGEYIASADELTHMLGSKYCFDSQDLSPPVGGGIADVPHGIGLRATLVKNSSGGALTRGLLVKWKTTAIGTEVDGVTASGGLAAGLVDPFGSGTIPDGASFYIIQGGQVEGTSGASFSAGDLLVPNNAGKFIVSPDTVAGAKAVCAIASEAATGADQTITLVMNIPPL